MNRYKEASITYLNIDNIHTMRESAIKLGAACIPYANDDIGWYTKIDTSGWLHHIHAIIKVIECLHSF